MKRRPDPRLEREKQQAQKAMEAAWAGVELARRRLEEAKMTLVVVERALKKLPFEPPVAVPKLNSHR